MNLEQLVATYHPSKETIDLVRQAKISLLVGIAGAGKDTIKQALLKESDFRPIVSHTTRAPRLNNGVAEVDGVDYHFIDQSAAEAMIASHEFIEVKFVHGTIYGTSAGEVNKAHKGDHIALNDIDVQGVAEYKALSPSVVAMFILPPDYDIWRTRLAKRYGTVEAFEVEWDKRRASAIKELTYALEVPYYHFIVNDKLERAIAVADHIAHQPDTFHRKDDEARLCARDLLAAIQANS
jgi:guanylate kinase